MYALLNTIIKQIIGELVDTEREYVKDLERLVERYVRPLRDEHFLPSALTSDLSAVLADLTSFQRRFRDGLLREVHREDRDNAGPCGHQVLRHLVVFT